MFLSDIAYKKITTHQAFEESTLLGYFLYDLSIVAKWLDELATRFATHDEAQSRVLCDACQQIREEFVAMEEFAESCEGIATPLLEGDMDQFEMVTEMSREKSFFVMDDEMACRLLERLKKSVDRIRDRMQFRVVRFCHRDNVSRLMKAFFMIEKISNEVESLLLECQTRLSHQEDPAVLPLPDSLLSTWLEKC